MGAQGVAVAGDALVANLITCVSCAPNSEPVVYLEFWNDNSVVIMKLRFKGAD
jgi:hypothetical protein